METDAEELFLLAQKIPQNLQKTTVEDTLAVDFLRDLPKFSNRDREAVLKIIKSVEDNIAEFTYRLEIECRNLNQCSEGKVLAAISFDNKVIYLNECFATELTNYPGRKNFTIAHELGHWFLCDLFSNEKLLRVS